MNDKQPLHDEAQFLLVQQHQLGECAAQAGAIGLALNRLHQARGDSEALLDQLLAQADAMASGDQVVVVGEVAIEVLMEVDDLEISGAMQPLGLLDSVQLDAEADWAFCLRAMDGYGARNQLQAAQDPFQHLMSDTQRIVLEKRIREEFSLTGANCDKYDYMIAGTCGMIGGLVDILFVGMPGKGALGKLADDATDTLVEKFAGLVGWRGANNPERSTASAIGFLERKFRVNYDQSTGADVGRLFTMSTKNHHVKNLAHSPDLIGLFFSLLNQFTSTSTFIADGKIISIDTKTFELQGSNFVSKIFAGFANWLGHLFSDMAGSSGAVGRGSGIPMPFYSLLQLINVGEFGQHRQTFATVAVRVFEEGYDLRHGLALSIPVLITELLTRMMWSVKQAFYHDRPLLECLPSAANPELRRMLMIAHGSLCMMDAADAAIRSGGEIVQFMLRSNLVAWARLGTLALKEVRAWYAEGSLDLDTVDDYLDREYRRMLA